jgi:hypothetical protein
MLRQSILVQRRSRSRVSRALGDHWCCRLSCGCTDPDV